VTPRIAPLPPTGNRPDIQELLDAATDATGGAANVVLTLARHPGLFRRFTPLSGKLLVAGKLPPALRELLILRTAWRCRCDYEWGQHVRIGQTAGLDEATITRVAGDIDPGDWSPLEQAVLRATDELVAGHRVEEDTWTRLAQDLDEVQLIELVMVVGTYVALAGFLNSAGVEREPGVPGFPAAAGR
jgi:alkylhydroperoxidase family enzyme